MNGHCMLQLLIYTPDLPAAGVWLINYHQWIIITSVFISLVMHIRYNPIRSEPANNHARKNQARSHTHSPRHANPVPCNAPERRPPTKPCPAQSLRAGLDALTQPELLYGPHPPIADCYPAKETSRSISPARMSNATNRIYKKRTNVGMERRASGRLMLQWESMSLTS